MRAIEYIERGHTVVCANVRLAHHFKHLYTQEQLRKGRSAWATPDILPWQAWLRRCRDSQRERSDTLLTSEQEKVLWQQIIEGSDYQNSLLQIPSVAGQAAAAWQHLKQYKVPIFPEGMPMNEDVKAFKTWADEYRSCCRQNNWIDSASLADTLRFDTADRPGALGRDLVLAGFDRLTPQQTLLCRELKAAGVSVHEFRAMDRNESVTVVDFADVDEEIRAAANWARQRLEMDGETTIGIITPDLRKLRTRIHYIFADVLAPGNLCYRNETTPLPYSTSVGQALADYPLIHVIFTLLGLGKTPPTLDIISVLLRTPFIKGHDQERAGRALLDEKLHSRKQLMFSWSELLSQAQAVGKNGRAVPVLAGMLRETRSLLEELPARQSPEAWTAYVTRVLETWGWPGERKPDSAEYQQVQAWHSLLDKLVSLRMVKPVMSRDEALSHLRRIAAATGFQPETIETPIQVLDPQGAAAMAFDHVWMLGLSEESWPPRPRPNPFIPIALQKQYEMPHADPGATLQQARLLQNALLRSTPRIVLSYARNEADRPLLGSPLLQVPPLPDYTKQGDYLSNPWHEEGIDQQPQVVTYSQLIFDNRKPDTLESFVDTMAPSVSGKQPGGVSLFQDQSQCPFRAFARHRLHSRQLEQADIGLDAMQRGNLLHQLMQSIWARLKSRDNLAGMTGEERELLIESLVRGLIMEARKHDPLLFTERFAAIESGRLAQVLREWLELELLRAPFTIVNLEERIQSAIAEIEFSARLDRVDALEDGRHVIIDYKSGNANVSDWAGDRPAEPQMPLYAVTLTEPVAAVAFARLKRGTGFGFAGLAESEDILPGITAFDHAPRATRFITHTETQAGGTPPTWEELLDNWRVVLHNLADEFRRGAATVTPKRGACDWCDQQPLCRIHEANTLTERRHG